jgi:dolichol-phosphate mannosyltransferase
LTAPLPAANLFAMIPQPEGPDPRVAVLERIRVGVVIPTYRAAATLAEVVRGVPGTVAYIFVVDDHSPDDVELAIREIQDPRLRLLRHETNRGVGAAMKTGYRAAVDAGCDVVVKMDADGQMDPHYLGELVTPLVTGEAGYAKGNRLWSLAAAKSMPRRRLLGNLFLSMATKAVSGYWNVVDPTNGFTAARADVLRRIDWEHVHDRYFFETSMLLELHLIRTPVRDVLMPARYPGTPSSLRLLPTSFEFSYRLAGSLLRRMFLEYVLLDLRPGSVLASLGAILVLFGSAFGGYHWHESVVTGMATLPGTVMVAALPVVLGVQLLLQAVLLDIAEVRNFAPLPPL